MLFNKPISPKGLFLCLNFGGYVKPIIDSVSTNKASDETFHVKAITKAGTQLNLVISLALDDNGNENLGVFIMPNEPVKSVIKKEIKGTNQKINPSGIYQCATCGGDFKAKAADRLRGWGLYCSKLCKANKGNPNFKPEIKPKISTQDMQFCTNCGVIGEDCGCYDEDIPY